MTPIAIVRAARPTSAQSRRASPVPDRSFSSFWVAAGPMRVSKDLLAPSLRVGVGRSRGDRRTVSIRGRLGELRIAGAGGRTTFESPPNVAPLATPAASGPRGLLISRFLASSWRFVSSPSAARKRPKSVNTDPEPLASAVAGSPAIDAAAKHRRQRSAFDCVLNRPQRLHRRFVSLEGNPGTLSHCPRADEDRGSSGPRYRTTRGHAA